MRAAASAVRIACSGLLPLAVAAVCLAPQTAQAQFLSSYFQNGLPVDRALVGPEVLARLRPEYQPQGVRAGDFVIRPSLNQSVGYDSNVVGFHDGPGSAFLETQAALAASSDWNRNSLFADVAVDNVAYTDLGNQSHTDWTASIGGTYDIGRDIATISYRHGSLHELPNDIGSLGIFAPVPYDLDYLVASYAATFGRFTVTPQFSVASFQFGTTTVNGVTEGGRFNDRIQPIGSVTVAYELSPSRDILFIVRGGSTNFQNAQTGSASRNSTGIAFLTGFQYAADAVVRYRALVGYEEQDYQSKTFRNQQAPVAEASAIWTPTGLTTVTGTLSRSIQDSLSGSTTGYTYTAGRLGVDHEYLPNVLLRASTILELQQQAATAVKSQTIYGGGVGVTWLLNRNARLNANYAYTRANQTSGYARNLVSVSLGLTL